MKADKNGYIDIYMDNFNELCGKLKMILNDNPNLSQFKFYGVRKGNKNGILVEGQSTTSGNTFELFYSTNDIKFYFDGLNKRLSRHGSS